MVLVDLVKATQHHLPSTTKYLGIVLNTRLSAEDNVVTAANKARRMLFYLKRPFVALTPSIYLKLGNFFYLATP